MNHRLELFDYLFITRPILFFPGWATLLAGYAAGVGGQRLFHFLSHGNLVLHWWHPRLAVALFAFAAAMGASFILNQLQDISSDKQNNKLFLLGEGHISVRAGYVEAMALGIAALALSLFLNVAIFVATLLFLLITGYAYNFRPLSFKNKPIAGVFANMAMGWLAFAFGWLLTESVRFELLIQSLPYLFFNTALYFLTTLPDVEGDHLTDKITFPIRYGTYTTIYVSLLCFALALGFSIWQHNEFMLAVTIISAPFFLGLGWKKTVPQSIITVKAGISAFALFICLQFPLFFVLLATLFFFTRYYYKNRFQYDYPNFKGQ